MYDRKNRGWERYVNPCFSVLHFTIVDHSFFWHLMMLWCGWFGDLFYHVGGPELEKKSRENIYLTHKTKTQNNQRADLLITSRF